MKWLWTPYEEVYQPGPFTEHSVDDFLRQCVPHFADISSLHAFLSSKIDVKYMREPNRSIFLDNLANSLEADFETVKGKSAVVPKEISLLWVAPADAGGHMDIRHGGEWTGDPEDWDWIFEADDILASLQCSLPDQLDELVTTYVSATPYDEIDSSSNWASTMLATLVCCGMFTKMLIDRGVLIVQRPTHIALGMPDAEGGVFLGEFTP